MPIFLSEKKRSRLIETSRLKKETSVKLLLKTILYGPIAGLLWPISSLFWERMLRHFRIFLLNEGDEIFLWAFAYIPFALASIGIISSFIEAKVFLLFIPLALKYLFLFFAYVTRVHVEIQEMADAQKGDISECD